MAGLGADGDDAAEQVAAAGRGRRARGRRAACGSPVRRSTGPLVVPRGRRPGPWRPVGGRAGCARRRARPREGAVPGVGHVGAASGEGGGGEPGRVDHREPAGHGVAEVTGHAVDVAGPPAARRLGVGEAALVVEPARHPAAEQRQPRGQSGLAGPPVTSSGQRLEGVAVPVAGAGLELGPANGDAQLGGAGGDEGGALVGSGPIDDGPEAHVGSATPRTASGSRARRCRGGCVGSGTPASADHLRRAAGSRAGPPRRGGRR